jgi:hypothetical protein
MADIAQYLLWARLLRAFGAQEANINRPCATSLTDSAYRRSSLLICVHLRSSLFGDAGGYASFNTSGEDAAGASFEDVIDAGELGRLDLRRHQPVGGKGDRLVQISRVPTLDRARTSSPLTMAEMDMRILSFSPPGRPM